MRATLLLRTWDFYVAMALLLLCAGGVSWGLQARALKEQSLSLVQDPLTLGQKFYRVNSIDGCVGSVQVTLAKLEGELDLRINSAVRAVGKGKKVDFRLDGEFTFNLLGQLGGAIVRIEGGDIRSTLGLENVNPVLVTIVSPLVGPRGRLSFSIPGPIELSATGRSSYALKYAPLARQPEALGGFLQQYSKLIGARLEDVSENQDVCADSRGATLSLDPLVRLIEEQAGMFTRLLPKEALGAPQ